MSKRVIPVGYTSVPVHDLEAGDVMKIYGEIVTIMDAGQRLFMDELSGEEYTSSAVEIFTKSETEGDYVVQMYDLYELVYVLDYATVKVDSSKVRVPDRVIPILSSQTSSPGSVGLNNVKGS